MPEGPHVFVGEGQIGVEWEEGSRLIPNQKTGEKIWLFDLGYFFRNFESHRL